MTRDSSELMYNENEKDFRKDYYQATTRGESYEFM